MPPAVSKSISVRCMSCRHRSTLDAAALKRFGVKPDAPIASFIKRLRCTKCGSGSVMAERVLATPNRRAS
jgi:ribosomal protein S27AE